MQSHKLIKSMDLSYWALSHYKKKSGQVLTQWLPQYLACQHMHGQTLMQAETSSLN